MNAGYYYQEGFCDASHYRGLYPVKYEQKAEKQPYYRSVMACSLVSEGKCSKKESCSILNEAAAILPQTEVWRLQERRYGE